MRKRLALAFALLAIISLGLVSEVGAIPWNDPKAGNPCIPGYYADPCIKKFGDTYYMYVTPDGWGVGQGPFYIWTSKDFVHWTANKSNWPTTDFKWAPSVVQKGSKYYLYTQVPCQVYVASADTPLGPWTNMISGGGSFIPDQTPPGTITLDGECFIDTDGQAYLWYGCWWTPTVVKLNADLCSYSSAPIQYFGSTTPYGTVQGCMEAPYMFKRNGVYYLMYSDNFCQDSSYQVKYSTGATALGPFTYGANNPILSTNIDGSVDGPGHHTILEDGGKIYIVYHRHDNPHDPDGAHRQTCIDELRFNADGTIEKIVPGHYGVGFLAPSTVRDTNLASCKPATASSYYSADFAPGYGTDENNGTSWKAKTYTFPQWLQVDLGASYNFKRVETEFQFAQVGYKYQIQYSSNGVNWTNFADRRTNTTAGSPMIDSGNATGRYVRITITGDNTPGRPAPEVGIWGFRVYDGVDKANQAPVVEAGVTRTGCIAFPTLPLVGIVTDDGLPNGPVTTTWSKISGPSPVTFRNADRKETYVTFNSPGPYVLKLTATDGVLTSSDTVAFVINSLGDKLINYKFDEASGQMAIDSSGNAQDAYLQNGAGRGTGAVGTALSCDGINDFVEVPALGSPGKLSIGAWIKLDSLTDSSIISANGWATGYPQFMINSSGKLQLSVNGCNPGNQTSNFTFSDKNLGNWTHVAVVYDNTAKNVKFYVNGVLDSTRTYTTAQGIVLTSGMRVGAQAAGRYFDGKIDELIMYNRALTNAEVTTLAGGVQWLKIGDARKLADGQFVTLKAKPVTYAPRDSNGLRTTPYFYIEEPDKSAVLRVDGGLIGTDAADTETGATVTGVLRTSDFTGERYLELTAAPEIESSSPVAAVYSNTKMIQTDPVLVGMLVKVVGKVKSIAADNKSLTISDGYKNTTEIKCETGTISLISVGNTVSVVGVVSKVGATPALATKVVLLRSIRRIDPPIIPITAGLVAWYMFDQNSGTSVLDSSGNGKTASLVNGPTWSTGKSGNAVNLDGADDHVSLPTGIMQGINDFTICTWVKLDAVPFWSRVFDFGTNTSSYMFLCNRGTEGIRYAITPTTGGEQIVDVNKPFTIGAWKHVAVTQSGNTVRIYMDGVQVASNTNITTKPTSLGASTNNRIGRSQYGDPLLDGKVDDFRIYNRALSAAEISQISSGY